jgi:hypothetical protein
MYRACKAPLLLEAAEHLVCNAVVMSETEPEPIHLFTFRRIAVSLVLLLALSFVPMGRAPSLAGWVQAYIQGNGKPHFPIPGTPESRIEDFLNRHPELRPQWREVLPIENGLTAAKD